MRLEEADVYTIPMPTSIQMMDCKDCVIIEIGGYTFKREFKNEFEEIKTNAIMLEFEIFHNEETIEVSYEDPYDTKMGKKIFKLSYELDYSSILLVRVKK